MILRIFMVLFLMLAQTATADTLEQARQALGRGAWAEVLDLLQNNQATEAYLLRGEAERAQGALDAAQREHQAAWQQIMAQLDTPRALKVWAAQTLAETQLARRQYPSASARLADALQDAEGSERAWLTLLQGRLAIAQGHAELARTALLSAQALGQAAGLDAVVAQARLNLCDLTIPPLLKELEEAAAVARQVNPGFARAELLLGVAKRARSGVPQPGYLNLARSLTEEITPLIEASRQRAEWLALRADLLEVDGRFAASLAMSDNAIAQAQGASDLMFQEEWRRGRLYHALTDRERALAAYRRAVFHLQTIRSNIPVEYQAGHSSFRETLEPFYLGLADLLLQQSATMTEDAAQPLLLEARDTVEQLKAAELQDYLQDSCLIETKSLANLEIIAPRTAVLYPIILPDRLELLLGVGGRQYRTSVAVQAALIREKSAELSNNLRPKKNATLGNPKSAARQIYKWLIAPLESWLTSHSVATLVFVPDGPLRLFPLGVLMKGDSYLIESYEIVTAPGLTLFDPEPLARGKIHSLVAGMSRPGPVIDELPASLLDGLVDAGDTTSENRGIRGIAINLRGAASADIRRSLQNPEVRKQIEDSFALPGVEMEVKTITEKLGGQLMMDQDFILSNFTDAMNRAVQLVHIASHGFFGGSPDDSFVMTYDRLLKMGQLESLIQADKEQPVELLILSACQTAEGNDRAPLGLSGVAIKAGARSAIGSLWPVSDDATQIMISEFYSQLIAQQTKAGALRQAQLKVLKTEKFKHPFFWSPFILIGNWL